MARAPGGRGRGRGRGARGGRVGRRGRVEVSAESVAQDTSVDNVSVAQTVHEGSGDTASVRVGVEAPVAGEAAGAARGRDDRLAELLTLLLERLPAAVPVQAPVVPPVAEAQPRAEAEVELPPYLLMMEQLQRIGTGYFSGGAKPEEAEEWRMRLERNFRAIRCPEGYRVDLAVHYLDGDAHLWWRGVVARRRQAVLSWEDFLAEFDAKFFPQEAIDRLELRFLELTQGDRSVREFDAEFSRLLVYAGRAMEDEQAQVKRFMRGLRPDLRIRCRGGRYASRVELVEAAAAIEEDLREQAGL